MRFEGALGVRFSSFHFDWQTTSEFFIAFGNLVAVPSWSVCRKHVGTLLEQLRCSIKNNKSGTLHLDSCRRHSSKTKTLKNNIGFWTGTGIPRTGPNLLRFRGSIYKLLPISTSPCWNETLNTTYWIRLRELLPIGNWNYHFAHNRKIWCGSVMCGSIGRLPFPDRALLVRNILSIPSIFQPLPAKCQSISTNEDTFNL